MIIPSIKELTYPARDSGVFYRYAQILFIKVFHQFQILYCRRIIKIKALNNSCKRG